MVEGGGQGCDSCRVSGSGFIFMEDMWLWWSLGLSWG